MNVRPGLHRRGVLKLAAFDPAGLGAARAADDADELATRQPILNPHGTA